MSDFKLDFRLQMPEREPVAEECDYCQQMHNLKEECEGTGYDSHQPPAYNVPQVEDSSYLKQALARFKKKQKAKKNVKN